MDNRIYPLDSIRPGIKKDGTPFDSECWIDGEWVRFQRGLPRKMGGYIEICSFPDIQRGVYVVPYAPNFNAYFGSGSYLKYLPIPQSGLPPLGPVVDRTPDLFRTDPNNDWTFGVMYDGTGNNAILVAHAAPNLFAIDNTVETPIYYGELLPAIPNTPLVPTALTASGGVVVCAPFLFGYGNYGLITATNPNDPTTLYSEAPTGWRATSQKIVYGLPTRGGNSSPAAIFWSLDSVIRMTNVGSNSFTPAFDTVSAESSILSSRGVIEYDGLYYWAGVDRFLGYNGTVFELPNDKVLNFFFDNINMQYREKVWATKVTRYGEVWWFFPYGNATECNYAVVYNVREQLWYSTPIARSDGYFDQTFAKPLWADNQINHNGQYSVWMHESGVDELFLDGTLNTVPSYVESSYISFAAVGPDGQKAGLDKQVNLLRFEPDFLQSGSMSITLKGKDYANSPAQTPVTINFTNTTEKIDIHRQSRELTIRFDSPAVGSTETGNDFQMGQCLLVAIPGDVRPGTNVNLPGESDGHS